MEKKEEKKIKKFVTAPAHNNAAKNNASQGRQGMHTLDLSITHSPNQANHTGLTSPYFFFTQ